MLDFLFVNCLLEEQLDEEDVEGAVNGGSHCVEEVKIGTLALRTWEN